MTYDAERAAEFFDQYGERECTRVEDGRASKTNGEVEAASVAGLLKTEEPERTELRDLLTRLELDLGSEPVAIDAGEHILAVLRTP